MNLKPFRKKNIAEILALAMILPLLTGCAQQSPDGTSATKPGIGDSATETVVETTVPTEPAPTTPDDGNPSDVTCQGSYTVKDTSVAGDTVVAVIHVYETEPAATEETTDGTAPATETPTEAPTEPAAEAASEAATEAAAEAPTEAPTEPPVEEEKGKLLQTVELTNRQLQVYYWMEVLAYRQSGHEVGPDFSQSLDTQICEIDDTVGSWQQYFLREALNTWAEAQSLVLWGNLEGIPLDERYVIREDQHEENLSHDLPASKYLYGYNGTTYVPNTLHQEYLDSLPSLLDTLSGENGFSSVTALAQDLAGSSVDTADLLAYADLYNRGYMFFTELTYDADEATAEEVEAWFAEHEAEYAAQGITRDSGKTVDMRHILMIPENAEIGEDGTITAAEDKAWSDLNYIASKLLKKIKSSYPYTEGIFATYAANNSLDPGSAMNGGGYVNIRKGQLIEELDTWLFDEARVEGDKEIIRSPLGMHIVYFGGSTENWYAAAEADLLTHRYQQIKDTAVDKYELAVDYSAIVLGNAEQTCTTVTPDSLLYADVAHERYPEAPLYLQQDYQTTMYGRFKVATYGCGITTLSMLATYMADEAYNVPIMCDRYGSYCTEEGTNRAIMVYETGDLGIYLREQIYDLNVVHQALEDGFIVVNLQHESYWTRGGHFLLLEKLNENGTVQVRDSNILNYGKLSGHLIDEHEWTTLRGGNVTNYIFWPKYVSCSQCIRCNDGQTEGAPEALFHSDYQCGKCDAALLRRNAYLNH